MNPDSFPALERLLGRERRRQRGPLALAAAAAAVASAAAVSLLGLSGWFITGAALAGLAGLAAAQAFNVLLPGAAIRLFAILRTGLRYVERVAGHEAALRSLANIRPQLFAAIAAAPPTRALGLSRGEASARLVQDVEALETLFIRRALPWTAGAALVCGGLAALSAGWAAAAVIAGLGAVFLLGTPRLAQRLDRGAGERLQRFTGELKDATAIYAGAAAELRCYGLEAWAADDVDARGRRLGAARQSMTRARAALGFAQAIALGFGVALVIAAACHAAAPLAAMAGLSAAVVAETLGAATLAFAEDRRIAEAARRLEPWLAGAAPASAAPPLANADITLDGDRFRPAARVLLDGASGAGKTTLMLRLLGLQPGPAGELAVGGCDPAAARPGASRAAFAYAAQDAQLLSGTIRDNLALADPDAGEAALWRALHDAALDATVRALPGGLDAWVGEDGARLSGGERRRLSLARALLRPAPWLLLDEPTEGLDDWTEALVLRRLRRRLDESGQGLLLASHSPAAQALCERVFAVSRLTPAYATATVERTRAQQG